MADVGNLIAKLKLDTSEFSGQADGLKEQLGSLASGIGTTLGGITAAVGAAVTAAAAGVASLVKESVASFGEYEQLVGGAQKIFDQMDYSVIAQDASEAWRTMNLSASEYLAMINDVGASFAATMGDQAGYETAKQGMQAIADYASGTGKDVGQLSEKFAMITRSASTYQSIADQFSGILPATSKDFLAQAQAAGVLSSKYKQLTDVPIAEYQQAVSAMLQKGVTDLGLAGNTVNETTNTITGSLAGLKAAWENLITGMSDSSADLGPLIDNVVEMAKAAVENILPAVSQALQGVATLIKELAPVIAAELPGLIQEVVPLLLDAAMSIVESLTQALPDIIESIMQAVEAILPQLADTVVSLIDTLVGTILPAIMDLGGALLVALGEAILNNMESLSESALAVIMGLIGFMTEYLPELVAIAAQIISSLAQFLSENLPAIVPAIVMLFMTILQAVIDNMPTILLAALQIILALVDGIINNLPMITDAVVILIASFVTTIIEHLPEILMAAIEIGAKIVAGIVAAIPNLIISVGKILGIVKDTKDQVSTNANTMQSSVNTSTTGINSDINAMISNLNSKTSQAKSTLQNSNKYTQNITDNMNKRAEDLQTTTQKMQEQLTGNFGAISDIVGFARGMVQDAFEKMDRIIADGTVSIMNSLTNLEIKFNGTSDTIVRDCNNITDAADKALSALRNLASAQSSGRSSGGYGGGHASGGWMSAGTTYLVGELGPELVTPTRSGYVHTADETAGMLGGSQTINITIQGDVYDDEYSMKRKLRNAVQDVLEEQMAYA